MIEWFSEKLLFFNFNKKDFLVKHLKEHKFFDKLPRELADKLNCEGVDLVWRLITTLPYPISKRFVCSYSKFKTILENAVKWNNSWSEREWILLEVIKNHNPVVFLNIISEKNHALVEVNSQFSKEAQNLAENVVKTKNFILVTPTNLDLLYELSELLNLCTAKNAYLISPLSSKIYHY